MNDRLEELEMQGRQRFRLAAFVVVLAALVVSTHAHAGPPGRLQRDRLAEGQRVEGQAMLALADAAMTARGGAPRGELTVRWRNAFLKAQQGTFVPFTLLIDARGSLPLSVLVYVRAVVRAAPMAAGAAAPPLEGAAPPSIDRKEGRQRVQPGSSEYPVDAIFPVELKPHPPGGASVNRGFSIAPGSYDIYVVVRERPGALARKPAVRSGVTVQALVVPDFRDGELATSSVILADRLTRLPEPLTADQLVERPYVFGQNEVTPADDDQFRRSEELVVVFLVYNPTLTPQDHFDLEVEYHFFERGGKAAGPPEKTAGSHPPLLAGERYFNQTIPQRFNPAVMGAAFDPEAGQPVLAGQEIPLAGFAPGEYRLAIKVTDRLSGKFVMRDVTFTVT